MHLERGRIQSFSFAVLGNQEYRTQLWKNKYLTRTKEQHYNPSKSSEQPNAKKGQHILSYGQKKQDTYFAQNVSEYKKIFNTL